MYDEMQKIVMTSRCNSLPHLPGVELLTVSCRVQIPMTIIVLVDISEIIRLHVFFLALFSLLQAQKLRQKYGYSD